MMRSVLVICCLVALSGMLSSCIGFVAYTPEECKYETPYTGARDVFWQPRGNASMWPFKDDRPKAAGLSRLPGFYPAISTKDDFLRAWGKPDKITTSEHDEVWTYNRTLWCGYTPVFFLPLPLVLPVCKGFDHVFFEGNEAKRLDTRRNVTAGFVATIGGGGGQRDPACRFPLPAGPAYTNVDTIPVAAGLVFVYWPGKGSPTTAVQYEISSEGQYLATVFPGSYYSFLVPVGAKELVFTSAGHFTDTVKIDVHEGKTYYVKVKRGVFGADEIKVTDSESAKREVEKCVLITTP